MSTCRQHHDKHSKANPVHRISTAIDRMLVRLRWDQLHSTAIPCHVPLPDLSGLPSSALSHSGDRSCPSRCPYYHGASYLWSTYSRATPNDATTGLWPTARLWSTARLWPTTSIRPAYTEWPACTWRLCGHDVCWVSARLRSTDDRSLMFSFRRGATFLFCPELD
jgi:hypothetical protein